MFKKSVLYVNTKMTEYVVEFFDGTLGLTLRDSYFQRRLKELVE
jgi:hypothetical protein